MTAPIKARLTAQNRARLCEKLMEHRFKADGVKLSRTAQAFTQQLYTAIFTPADRKKMRALPDGWLPETKELSFKIGTETFGMNADGAMQKTGFDRSKAQSGCMTAWYYAGRPTGKTVFRVPDTLTRYGAVMATFKATDAIADKYTALCNAFIDFYEQQGQVRSQIEATLSSVNTTAKLVEVWPEVAPIVAIVFAGQAAKANLPAIPRADLNAALNLPTKQAAAKAQKSEKEAA